MLRGVKREMIVAPQRCHCEKEGPKWWERSLGVGSVGGKGYTAEMNFN